jgi:hypothetical protein
MWNLISCYLSGRHDYQVRCVPGAIYLCCHHCGKRSMGWELRAHAQGDAVMPMAVPVPVTNNPRHASAHAHSV